MGQDLESWSWEELEAEADRLEAEVRRRALASGAVSLRVTASLLGAVETELRRADVDAAIRHAGLEPAELRDGERDGWIPWAHYVRLLVALEDRLTPEQAHRAGASMLASRWLRFLLQSAGGFTDLEVSLRWASRAVFGPGSLAFRGCEATVRRREGGRVQIRYAPPAGTTFPPLWLALTRGAVGRFADLVGGRGDRIVVERDGATVVVVVERTPGWAGRVKAMLSEGVGTGALEDTRTELRLRNRELRRRLEEIEAAERGRERLMLKLASRREQEAVGRLAGGVAHDLNNLLAAMRMQLDLMRCNHQGDGTALREIDGMLEAVVQAAARARELLDLRRQLDGQDVAVDELEIRGLGAEDTTGASPRDALIAQVEVLQAQLAGDARAEAPSGPATATPQVAWRNVPATLMAAERIGLPRHDVIAGLSWTLDEDAAPDRWLPWSRFNELLEQIGRLAGEEGLRALGAQALDTPLFAAIGPVTGAFFDEADLFDWLLRFVFGPQSSYFVGLPAHVEVHGPRELRVVWESRGAPIVRALAVTLAGIVEHAPRLVGRAPATVSLEVFADRIVVDARLAPRRALSRVLSHLRGRTRARQKANALRRTYMDLIERNQGLSEKILELEVARARRRQLERRLEQVRPMVAASQVAARVAHDFNNALTVIRGHAMLLELHIQERAQQEALDVILEAASQATQLTQRLRVIGRGEPDEPGPIDVAVHLDTLAPFLRGAVGPSTRLVVRRPPSLHRGAAIGAAELERILLNLVTNAREARATEIGVGLEEVELDASFVRDHPGAEPGPHLRLEVRDDGEGMAPEVLARAFEPYFTTKDDGSGVGLATVFGMVHVAGGTTWVDSEPGEGTTFRLYLPSLPLPAAATIPSSPQPPSTRPPERSGEILVIDDDVMLRAVLARLVRSGGYDVTVASSGDEALALVRRGCRPDLVVSDVVMPGLRGEALTEALRAALGPVPILFVSGFSDVPLALGSDVGFLAKPFSRDDLLSRVAKLLQRARRPQLADPR